MARLLRVGKAWPLRKQTFFQLFYFILLLFENKRYFNYDNISQYQYWQCWQSHSLLAGLLQYLAENMALLVQKLCGGKKLSKSVFGYFKTKKKSSDKEKNMFMRLPL